ncbi:MAG: 23S rRNA (guanosine(2251)-2'-O)-methyltransferase RlmB [Gammaproteobacteria bacterium]
MSVPAAEHVFGVHAVHAVLHNQPAAVRELRLAAGSGNPRLQRLRKAAQAAGIPVLEVRRESLDEWAGAVRHQGVMAILGEEGGIAPQSLEGLLEGLAEAPFLLVLDGIQDPHNLGACLRSAAAAGVHGVIAPKDRAVGLTPVVRKVACGAAEQLPFIQVTNLARTLRRLQELGLWIAGADSEAPQTLYEADLSGSLALVMGAEGKGLRRLTRECCDLLLAIPMASAMESLNVSVATGICLFEARRQRMNQV